MNLKFYIVTMWLLVMLTFAVSYFRSVLRSVIYSVLFVVSVFQEFPPTHSDFLKKELRELFQGDLRIILDYLCDRESLLKRNQTMKHPEEVIRMLHALTGDDQYLNSIPLFTSPAKKGESTVCDLINSYYNEGHNTGLIEGRNSGLIEGRNSGLIEGRNQGIQALILACKDFGCSFENTLARIKDSFSLSDDEALEDMKLYW